MDYKINSEGFIQIVDEILNIIVKYSHYIEICDEKSLK